MLPPEMASSAADFFDFPALPAGVQAKVLSYAVCASIVDPKEDPDYDYDEEEEGPNESLVEGLGWQGDYECTLHVRATIKLGDAVIGSAKFTLVDRTFFEGGDSDHDSDEEEDDEHDESNNGISRSHKVSFHMACDAESQELQEVSVAFFARDGCTPRLAAVRALGDEVRSGGVCYLSTFEIDDPQSNGRLTSDIAAEALTQLLGTGPLADKWTFCVFIPSATDQMTAAEKLDRRGRWAYEEVRSPEERRADALREERLLQRDAKPFLRVGFLQAEELISRDRCPYLYCARSALRAEPLDRAAAASASLRAAPPPPPAEEPTAADKAFGQYLMMTFQAGFNYDGVPEAEYPAAEAELAEKMREVEELQVRLRQTITHIDALAAGDTSALIPLLAYNSSGMELDPYFSPDVVAAQIAADPEGPIAKAIADLAGEKARLEESIEHNDTNVKARLIARRARFDAAEARHAAIPAEIRRHVEECGATVAGARALHIAAANSCSTWLDVLLELSPGPPEDCINWPDPTTGVTPLCVAASGILGKSSQQKPASLDFLRALIDRGADRSATDHRGLSALGHFWTSVRNRRDYLGTFGIKEAFAYDRPAFVREIEALVAPPDGPTPADEAARDEDDADAADDRKKRRAES